MDLSFGLGLIIVSDWLLIFTFLFGAYYLYSTWHFNVWKEKGIPGPKPYFVVGSNIGMFTKGFWDTEIENYRKYGKLFGAFEGRTPVLMVSDEEMLKEILVKEFSSFANRRTFTVPNDITDKFLSVMGDDDWKRVRNMITPTFTSGKLKYMSKRIQECAKLLADNFEENAKDGRDFEVKELCGAFTMDVIARTAFGLQVDSQKEKDNQFVKMGKKAFSFSLFSPVFIAVFFFPFLLPLLGKLKFNFFPKDAMDFFKQVVEQTLERRKDTDNSQQDFLQLMSNAHNEQYDHKEVMKEASEAGATFDDTQLKTKKGLSKNEILAQGILFFLAGFETTASAVTFLLYQLSINPDIQDKLYEEIEEKLGDKEMDYNKVNEMEYLDKCFNESLRLYPPAFRFDRKCGNDITIKGIHIPKGAVVAVPVVGIHRDPEIYPEPEKFDPERFSPEAKAARSPFHYLPFGYGPRNCIGMRLAIIEAKMAVVQILKQVKLLRSEKTKVPIKLEKTGILRAEGGLWLRCEKRT